MTKWKILALLFFTTSSAHAGKISDLFSDGVFGVEWGATIETVKKAYPEGSVESYLGIKNYIVPHSKPVLKIPRENTDITFSFNSLGQLNAVGVSFEGNEFGEVYTALKTYFGDHSTNTESIRLDWPEDEGIKMYLITLPEGFSVKPTLTIENVTTKASASKDDLGFN